MTPFKRVLCVSGYAAALPLCLLLAVGCNKKDDAPTTPTGMNSSAGMSRPPGGMRGGPGGGGSPLAENASGAEIYQQKCQNCHGEGGKGKNAPSLIAQAKMPEDALAKVIHDGKGRMPAFGSQLSEDQIKKVVATVKAFQ